MHAGAGETRNGLVSYLACSRDGLGKQALDLLAGLGTIKEDGTPALPVGHFLTPKASQIGLRGLPARRFGSGDVLFHGRLGAEPLAGAVIDPGNHDREQQKHQAHGDQKQKRIGWHLHFSQSLTKQHRTKRPIQF
jgi:hypothetical protein